MLFHRNTVPLPNAWPHAKLGRDAVCLQPANVPTTLVWTSNCRCRTALLSLLLSPVRVQVKQHHQNNGSMRTWGGWQQMQHTTLRYNGRSSLTNPGALCFQSVQAVTWVQQGTLGNCLLQNERNLSSFQGTTKNGELVPQQITLPVCFRTARLSKPPVSLQTAC